MKKIILNLNQKLNKQLYYGKKNLDISTGEWNKSKIYWKT